MDFDIVKTIAGQEVRISIRNKWVFIFTAVFGALALAISYFGLRTAGLAGLQGFVRTAASLLNLVLYLIPIVSLSMGTLSLTGEKGANELLFSQPVTSGEVLAGKFLGLAMSMVAALLFGFGLAGLVILTNVGREGFLRFIAFVGLAVLLALVFLSLGMLVAVLARTKAKAIGVSLLLWFFFVLFYDLLVIGLAFVLRERTANFFIFVSLFGNPVDMVRVSGLIALSDSSIFGVAGAALVKFLGGGMVGLFLLLLAIVLWVVSPLWIANRVLRSQDV